MNEGHVHAKSPCVDYIYCGNELESYCLYEFFENTYEDTICPSRLRPGTPANEDRGKLSWYNLSSFLFHLQLHLTLSTCPLTPPCQLSGHVQDQEHTGCLGACRALTDLQRVTQGEHVPAE